MRKFVAIVAALVVTPLILVGGTSTASAAADYPFRPPRQCSPDYHGVLSGEGVNVFCNYGPSDYFRVIAHCETPLAKWWETGRVAYTGEERSLAECRGGLLSTAHVTGYHIDWV